LYTTLHGRVLIISCLFLQTIIIAQMVSTGGEREVGKENVNDTTVRHM